jgi:hypothetical protein
MSGILPCSCISCRIMEFRAARTARGIAATTLPRVISPTGLRNRRP